jgi:hypothetical protein
MADQVVDSATAPSDFRGRAPRAVDQFVGAPHRQDNVWHQEGGVAITVKCEGRLMNVPKTDKRYAQACGTVSYTRVFAESHRRDAEGKVIAGDHLSALRTAFEHLCPRCKARTAHVLVSVPVLEEAKASRIAKLQTVVVARGASQGEVDNAQAAVDRLKSKPATASLIPNEVA